MIKVCKKCGAEKPISEFKIDLLNGIPPTLVVGGNEAAEGGI